LEKRGDAPIIQDISFNGFRLVVCYKDAIEVFNMWETLGEGEVEEEGQEEMNESMNE